MSPTPSLRTLLPPVLVGAVLRLLGLTRQSFWVDENLTLRAASVGHPFHLADVLHNPQGPLPHLWLRAWIALGGEGDLSLRLWAATAGILGLVLAAAAFRHWLPRAAVAATWILALNPFHLWYSQEVRNYAFLLAAAALVLLLFARALDAPARRGRWAALAGAMAALFLSNLSGLFLAPALLLVVVLEEPRQLGRFALALAVALVVTAPWIVVELTGHMEWAGITGGELGGEPIRGGSTFTFLALPYTAVVFLAGFGAAPPLRELHAGASAAAWGEVLPLLVLLGAGALWALFAALGDREERRPVRALVLLAGVPVVLAAGVALLGLKAYSPRYVAVALLPLVLLVGHGWTRVASGNRVRGIVLGLLLLVPMLLGGVRQTFLDRYAKEDHRGAAAILAAETRPGDLVLEQGVALALDRYYPGPAEVAAYFPVYRRTADGGEGRLDSLLSGHDRVFWVGSRLWYDDPEGWLTAALAARSDSVEMLPRVAGVELRLYRLESAR